MRACGLPGAGWDTLFGYGVPGARSFYEALIAVTVETVAPSVENWQVRRAESGSRWTAVRMAAEARGRSS